MRRLTCVLVSSLAIAACTQEASTPPEAVPQGQDATVSTAPPVSYACESGESVAVAYADSASAQLTYKGQAYALRPASSASGARYVGSELEWWTVNRDGTETATLSRLGPDADIGGVVLERCSRPAAALPVAPPPAPQGDTSAAAPCRGPQLRLSDEGGDAGAGNRVRNIGLQNIGAAACSLTGYPGVVLQDRQGRALTAIRAEQAPGSYFTEGQAPAPVILAPQDKAAFELAWNVMPNEGAGERTCPSATRIRVTAPGDTSPVGLDLGLTPCGGRVKVSPVRPLAAGGAQPPEPTA